MRILVADDDAGSRLILETALAHLGHEVVAARDGEEAWEKFRHGTFEVVVSDRSMPGLDGIEFCRRVRALESRPYAYFVFLTAATDKGRIVEGLEAGADDYLLKPFDNDRLAARLIAAERVTGLYRALNERQRELEILNRRLHEQARTDPLTGFGTRLKLREDLDLITAGPEAGAKSYCAIMCDVDFFKRYNDSCGHLAGDDALATIAATIRRGLRYGSEAYRYGGEEFLLIEPGTTLEQGRTSAERHRASIEALRVTHEESPFGIVTISLGVVSFRPGEGISVNAWLKAADEAAYRAKASGRNRVMVGELER
ncbi:MAG TPA: diguanylate cyclase [Thermohalobaculum sp.]|nr:diguanylate cyclase [Thermohalobaculum sp.]